MDLKLQYDKLLRYCYHKTKSKDLAEDIVQETFLKFWQTHSYEDTGKERVYIARNLCADIYRRQESNQEYPEDLPCPDYDPEQTLNRIAVDTALEQMPEQLREMVVMRYVSELSAAEIGKIMNLSRFAVNRRLKELLYKQIVYVFSTEKGDTKMNNTLLGKTLKAMYKQSGKTITQLSDETGLSIDTINNFLCPGAEAGTF